MAYSLRYQFGGVSEMTLKIFAIDFHAKKMSLKYLFNFYLHAKTIKQAMTFLPLESRAYFTFFSDLLLIISNLPHRSMRLLNNIN
jgi:hypothetical protein